MQGWKSKLFSMGGKEILIKSIAQAIATYAMSCFQPPKGIVNQFSSLCAKFWWRDSDDNRKIHWMC